MLRSPWHKDAARGMSRSPWHKNAARGALLNALCSLRSAHCALLTALCSMSEWLPLFGPLLGPWSPFVVPYFVGRFARGFLYLVPY